MISRNLTSTSEELQTESKLFEMPDEQLHYFNIYFVAFYF